MNLPGGGIATKDLFMAPRKRTVWVNLYSDNTRPAWHYESQEKADRNIGPGRIGDRAYPIEIEE
jgi:hypothetical protein